MFVAVDGLQIRYELSGSGSAVLLLHGWGGTGDSLLPVVHCLSRSHEVCAIDLPGFGKSTQPDAVWGSHDYARFVAAFMDAVGCPRAHVVAHSFGGRIAICLAVKYPTRIGKLVLVDSAGIRPPRTFGLRARGWTVKGARSLIDLIPSATTRDAFLTRLYGAVGSADYRQSGAMRGILVRAVNEDLRPLLPTVDVPTLVVWGENDRDVPLSYGRLMAGEIPHARLEVLSGAGHFPYIDRLPKFCQLVRDFLKDT